MGGMSGGSSDKQQMPAAFTPDQLENKYSKYKGKPLDWPAQYEGEPTDARGNKISSYKAPQATIQWVPGTTLDSGGLGGSGAERQLAGWAALDPIDVSPNTLASLDQSFGSSMATQPLGTRMQNAQAGNIAANMPASMTGDAQTTTTPGSYQTVQPSAADMSAAYMSALAKPGAPQRQGANVPQAAPPSVQSNVLDQFLANWKAGGSQTKGAGNYDNSGFFKGLA